MKPILQLLLICLVFIFSERRANAQVSFKNSGKNYVIPEFRYDTFKPSIFSTQFEHLGLLTPIKDSKNEIELRAYYADATLVGKVVVIKGNSTNLDIEVIYCRHKYGDADTIPWRGFKVIKHDNVNHIAIKKLKPADTLLNSLIKNHFFSYNEEIIIDSLTQKNIKLIPANVLDGYDMIFQVKVNNNYRSFIADPFTAGANKNVKELLPGEAITNIFNQLFTWQ